VLQAWVGDELVPVDAARISVFDRGFRAGEGVFETLRAYGDHPFRLTAHLDRAHHGAATLGFEPPTHDALADAIRSTVAANHPIIGGDSAVRLTVTPGAVDPASPHPGRGVDGPTVVVTVAPLEVDDRAYADGVSATAVPWARELPHVKALSYLAASMARREAHAEGAHEALLTDDDGHVLEGASSNVFAVVRGRLVTPPATGRLLAGVTRSVVLEVAADLALPVHERPLTLTELATVDEAFLTASTREVVPLVRAAGRRIGTGRPGPMTRSIHEGYRAAVRREIAGS